MPIDSARTTVPCPLPLPAAPTSLPPGAPAAATVGVLHLINGEHYAGAERVQDLLAKCLPEFGYRVGFACLKLRAFAALRQSQGAPLWDLPMRTRFDLRAAAAVARLVRRHDFRIVHAHTVRTVLVGRIAAAVAGVPLVYHAHSPTSRDSTRRWRDAANGLIERLSLPGVSRVIAVSRAMAEEIGRGYDRRRIAVVPNGVPPLAAVPAREKPRPPWTMGMVALFRPRKGTEVLLEAMAMLRNRAIPVRLRAVGTFESPAYEREIAARLRRLRLEDRSSGPGLPATWRPSCCRSTSWSCRACLARGCRWWCSKRWPPACRSWPPRGGHGRGRPPRPRWAGGRAGRSRQTGGRDRGRGRGPGGLGRHAPSAIERQAACFSDRVMAQGVAAVYNGLL